jgi:hypothetical protein
MCAVADHCTRHNETSDFQKGFEFLEQLSAYQLLRGNVEAFTKYE